jgi:hypothetical protein
MAAHRNQTPEARSEIRKLYVTTCVQLPTYSGTHWGLIQHCALWLLPSAKTNFICIEHVS